MDHELLQQRHHLHDRLRDDVAAHALGTLDPAAVAQVERHLAGCPSCRALAAEYRAVVDLIPLGLTPVLPSPGTRDRLLAPARHRDRPRAVVTPAWWRWTGPAAKAVAAVAAVLVVALGLVVGRGLPDPTPTADDPAAIVAQLRGRDDVRVLSLAGSPAAPGGRAELLLPAAGTTAGLAVADLPPLPPGRSYQFWFARPDQTRVSGGLFAVDARGDAVAALTVPPDLAAFARVGVTEEPVGGSPAPTGTNVLGGAL